jgi:F-type H+-transporting ATPase subunit a
MEITPDQMIYWEWGIVTLNATLVFSWVVLLFLSVGSWLVTRNLELGPQIPRWQNLLEIIVSRIRSQIAEASGGNPDRYLPFVGTLFLFIVVCNVLDAVPGFKAPTASLTTTAALATCVFVAVPVFGIARQGVAEYFRQYVHPTPLMLPFHVIGELSRTLALAVRLFGNITSGSLIVAIVLSIAPLFFPVVMQALGLLIGVIQAYVFAILALVYIASAERAHQQNTNEPASP